MNRIALLLTALSVAALSASGSLAGPSAVVTGLAGKALRGPITPVCRFSKPCYVPYRGALVFAPIAPGAAVGPPIRTQTEPDGDYRIELAPSWYRVSVPKASRFGGLVSPSVVAVPATGMRRVRIVVDTGIR